MKKKFKRVVLMGSDYALMLYLLSSSKEDIESSFFVFSQGIPETVRGYFKEQCYDLTTLPKNKILNECALIWIHFSYRWRWPFMKKAEFWGMPIVGVEFLGNRKIHQIEEGGEHLGLSANNARKMKWVRRLLHGWWYENYTLDSPKIASLVLTRQLKYPTCDTCKKTVIDVSHLWETNNFGRKVLLESHGVSEILLNQLKSCKYLLLTQTLSEDGTLPLEREIELYKQLIKGVNMNELLIKPHPREYIDKKSYFPGATIFPIKCPMQLLAYCGFHPEIIYTINSTSVYSLPYKDVKIKFLGTTCDERLVERFGVMESKGFE